MRVAEIVKKMGFSSEGYARKRKFKCKEQLIKLVRGDDPEEVMPPKGKRLTTKQIATLREWITQGAVWPDNVVGKGTANTHW